MKAIRNTKIANQHTACVYCGELVFDRLLRRCRRCGGTVVYLSEEDLTLLGRHRPRPINPPAVDE